MTVRSLICCLTFATLPLLSGSVTLSVENDADNTLSDRRVKQLVTELGSSNFKTRQMATIALWSARSVTALKHAASSDDAEVRSRANRVLADLKYEVYPETDPSLASLLRQYRDGDEAAKKAAWDGLEQSNAVKSMLLLHSIENREDLREFHSERLIKFTIRESSHLVALDLYSDVEELLRWAAGRSDLCARNWAAFLYLRGDLNSELRHINGRLAEDANKADQRLAVYLHRANGDLTTARDGALSLPDSERAVQERALFDVGDWGRLSALVDDNVIATDIEQLGMNAAYHRLAGNVGRFDLAVDQIKQLGNRDASMRFHCIEALFLNLQAEEAIELLTEDNPAAAFKVLHRTGRFADAFVRLGVPISRETRLDWLHELLGILPGRSREAISKFELALEVANALYSVGERDEVKNFLEKLYASLAAEGDVALFHAFCECAYNCSQIELAHSAAVDAIQREASEKNIKAVFGKVFPRHSELAWSWWALESGTPSPRALAVRVMELRTLFSRDLGIEATKRLFSDAVKSVTTGEAHIARRSQQLEVIGRVAAYRGEHEIARRCFEESSPHSFGAAILLADIHRAGENWEEAAKSYQAAWERDGTQLAALYMSGEMRLKVGDIQAGNQLRERARLIGLAAATRYKHLVSGLYQRGQFDQVRQECELIVRTEDWSAEQMFAACGALGEILREEQPLQAAAYWEFRMLNCLRNQWNFTDITSYVTTPHLIHSTRAKAFLQEGKIGESIIELRACQRIWPGDLNIPEVFVPQLDEVGQTGAADELFNRAYELIDETCGIFPNSALHHNNAAWLAAKCKRRLDDALAHVNRALELVPNEAQYIDTQGEVYFQQGKTDLAIDCAKQCIELAPNTTFYQEQLTRFQAAQQQPQ